MNYTFVKLKTQDREFDNIFYFNLINASIWACCDNLNFTMGESDIDALYFAIPYENICISTAEEYIDGECRYQFLVISCSVWSYEKRKMGL